MERGRTFYITLANGFVALVLLLTSVNLPAHLVIESKPYALVVLKSGKLDGWTAEDLGITSAQLALVKNNYAEFLSSHRTAGDSDSDDSDSSDSDDEGHPAITHVNHTNNDADDDDGDNDDEKDSDEDKRRRKRDDDEENDSEEQEQDGDDDKVPIKTKVVPIIAEDSSSSSSDEDGGEESSDSVELTLEQKLEDKPVKQTLGLGLFHATICNVQRSSQEHCYTVSVNEAIFVLKQEVPFAETEVNMPMWNNLRVESLFSVIACALGMVCLVASLRPCCDNVRLPVYLGSLCFLTSGVLVFLPIVRVLLVSSDFTQSLETSLNVTTRLMTSWALVACGFGAPFAFLASFTLIATKWYKISKKWYHHIKSPSVEQERMPNGNAVEINMTDLGRHDTQDSIYQNIEEKTDLLNEIDEERKKMSLKA